MIQRDKQAAAHVTIAVVIFVSFVQVASLAHVLMAPVLSVGATPLVLSMRRSPQQHPSAHQINSPATMGTAFQTTGSVMVKWTVWTTQMRQTLLVVLVYRAVLSNFAVCTVASAFLKIGTVMEIMIVGSQICRTSQTARLQRVPMLNSNVTMANALQVVGAVMVLMIVETDLMSLNVIITVALINTSPAPLVAVSQLIGVAMATTTVVITQMKRVALCSSVQTPSSDAIMGSVFLAAGNVMGSVTVKMTQTRMDALPQNRMVVALTSSYATTRDASQAGLCVTTTMTVVTILMNTATARRPRADPMS